MSASLRAINDDLFATQVDSALAAFSTNFNTVSTTNIEAQRSLIESAIGWVVLVAAPFGTIGRSIAIMANSAAFILGKKKELTGGTVEERRAGRLAAMMAALDLLPEGAESLFKGLKLFKSSGAISGTVRKKKAARKAKNHCVPTFPASGNTGRRRHRRSGRKRCSGAGREDRRTARHRAQYGAAASDLVHRYTLEQLRDIPISTYTLEDNLVMALRTPSNHDFRQAEAAVTQAAAIKDAAYADFLFKRDGFEAGNISPEVFVASENAFRHAEQTWTAVRQIADARKATWEAANAAHQNALAKIEELRLRLFEDSDKFHNAFSFVEAPEVAPQLASLHIPLEASDESIIQSIFQAGAKGIVLGEIHTESYSRLFLIRRMKQLKREGVEVLFLEGVTRDLQQPWVDKFIRGEIQLPIPGVNDAHGMAPGAQLSDVIVAARDAGIEVQGLEQLAAFNHFSDNYNVPDFGRIHGPMRMKSMNYFAAKVIQQKSGGRKWVALVGNNHVSSNYLTHGFGMVEMLPDSVGIGFNRGRTVNSRAGITRQSEGLVYNKIVTGSP